MEFITTEKGQRKLIRNGYNYVFKKMLANDVSCWSVFCVEKTMQSHYQDIAN